MLRREDYEAAPSTEFEGIEFKLVGSRLGQGLTFNQQLFKIIAFDAVNQHWLAESVNGERLVVTEYYLQERERV